MRLALFRANRYDARSGAGTGVTGLPLRAPAYPTLLRLIGRGRITIRGRAATASAARRCRTVLSSPCPMRSSRATSWPSTVLTRPSGPPPSCGVSSCPMRSSRTTPWPCKVLTRPNNLPPSCGDCRAPRGSSPGLTNSS
eukprot:52155-Eustigmatos_ZCMA.PRE.1